MTDQGFPASYASWLVAVMLPVMAASTLAADEPLLTESRAITAEFAARLQSALQGAMSEGGAVGAIDVCKEIAPQIASELSRRSGAQVSRTSLRIRNPGNLPADWQVEVLRNFEGKDGSPDATKEFFQRRENGEFRYMKAIPTGGLCIACHGTTIPYSVKRILSEHYPHDRAVGYEAGDVRGAFSVVWPNSNAEDD